jgi:hypothetical protein
MASQPGPGIQGSMVTEEAGWLWSARGITCGISRTRSWGLAKNCLSDGPRMGTWSESKHPGQRHKKEEGEAHGWRTP